MLNISRTCSIISPLLMLILTNSVQAEPMTAAELDIKLFNQMPDFHQRELLVHCKYRSEENLYE